jgi:hypothetical protein
MMGQIRKQILDSARVRTIPEEGFSWIDRRFLRHGFADPLGSTEILLYWFLCSVADRHGLSYYSDQRIGRTLKLGHEVLDQARLALVRNELVLFRDPLYQVTSLPHTPTPPPVPNRARMSLQSGLRPIREILKDMM